MDTRYNTAGDLIIGDDGASIRIINNGMAKLFVRHRAASGNMPSFYDWVLEDSDPPGYNALHYAARIWYRISDAFFRALFKRLDLNTEEVSGKTPLVVLLAEFDVVPEDNIPVDYKLDIMLKRVEFWLQNGAKLHVQHDNSNAILWIPERYSKRIVDLLFAYGAGWALTPRLSYVYSKRPMASAALLPRVERFRAEVLAGLKSGTGLIAELQLIVMGHLFHALHERKRRRGEGV